MSTCLLADADLSLLSNFKEENLFSSSFRTKTIAYLFGRMSSCSVCLSSV